MMQLLGLRVKFYCHEDTRTNTRNTRMDSWIPIVMQKLVVSVMHFYMFDFQQNAVNALVVAVVYELRVFRRRDAATVGYDLRILRVVQPFPHKRHGRRTFS